MNRLEIKTNYSSNESPYKLFSSGHNFGEDLQTFSNSSSKTHRFYIKKSKKDKNNICFRQRPLTAKTKDEIQISLISKNLKSMTLSNELYLNYMDYYSNLTQDYCFKSPKVSNYPIRKNEKYLSIKSQQKFNQSSKGENPSKNNIIFFDYMRENEKKGLKKEIEIKPYGFKYGETKIRIGKKRVESARQCHINGKEFQNLCESGIYESKLLKQIGLKNIDIYNSKEEKNKNFNFFNEYLKQIDFIDNIMDNDNSFKNIKFQAKTSIVKRNLSFKLDIYSLCFKFYLLENKEKPQKLYFPFKLMPLFYLLDLQSFNVFLSEIIYFDNAKNCLSFVENDLLSNKIKKYYLFLSNNTKNNKNYINYISYNKNELSYYLLFDWIISDKKNSENNILKSYKCYKLKITLPKIKFFVENYNIKIIKHLNKHIIANLILHDFDNWEKFTLFDLFINRKFKDITNLIMENRHYLLKTNKFILNKDSSKFSSNNNKNFSFYLTEAGENYSNFFIFIPHIILVLYGEHKKRYKKINLTWKESKNLLKFKNNWGIIDTLLKCMFVDNITKDIYFRFELLDNINNDLYKIIIKENPKKSNKSVINIKTNNINNSLFDNKSSSKSNLYHLKEKEKNKIKYKTNKLEISVLECSLKKINITEDKSESKYYKIPQEFLKTIFEIKNDKELFNSNFNEVSIIGKCIGECSKSILDSSEINIVNEEQTMMKKAKDSLTNKILNKFVLEFTNINQNNKIMASTFNKFNPFKIGENKINKKNDLGKTIKQSVDKHKEMPIKKKKISVEKKDKKYKVKFKGAFNIIKSNINKEKLKISNKKDLYLNRIKSEISEDNFMRQTSKY